MFDALIGANRIFRGETIDLHEDRELPRDIARMFRHESMFHGVVIKRIGVVTASDFVRWSRRLVAVCLSVHPEMQVEFNSDFHGDAESVSLEYFKDVFDFENVTILRVCKPHTSTFASVSFHRRLPRVIEFYAQDGYRYGYLEGEETTTSTPVDGSIERAMERAMFFVPGSAPSMNWGVRVGISETMKITEGESGS